MAAATTIVTAGLQVGSAVKSFSQSKKQQTAATRAQFAADQAMTSAKKELSKNFYSGLDINLKAYDQQRDALAGVADRLVTAGQESERGAAATAGAVLLGANEAEKDITNNQIGAIEALEQSVAKEEGRLAGLRSDLNLAEAEGAQQAAADAAKAEAAAITGGIQGLSDAAGSVMKGAELYGNKKQRQNKRNAKKGNVLPSGLEVDDDALSSMLKGGGIDGSGDALKKTGTGVGNALRSVGGVAKGLFNSVSGLFAG